MQGSAAAPITIRAASFAAANFYRYERRDAAVVIKEGEEPQELLDLLEPVKTGPVACKARKPKKGKLWKRALGCFSTPKTLE